MHCIEEKNTTTSDNETNVNALSLNSVPVKTVLSDHYCNFFTSMILIGPHGKPRDILQREIPIHGLVKRLSGGNLMLNSDKSGVVQFLTFFREL